MAQLGGTAATLRTTGRWLAVSVKPRKLGYDCGLTMTLCRLGSGGEDEVTNGSWSLDPSGTECFITVVGETGAVIKLWEFQAGSIDAVGNINT